MTATKAYIEAWKSTFKASKMWLLIYGITFLVAALSMLPLKGFMSSTVGNSLALNKSLPGFDYTFIGDVLNEYGAPLSLILDQSLVWVLLFFVISVFLMGGILAVFKQRPVVFNTGLFWQGCGAYFWRFLRLSVFFFLFQAILLGLCGVIYFKVSNGMSPFETDSENQWILSFRIISGIYLLIATFLFIVHDYTKWHIVHTNPSLLTASIANTFRLVFKNIGRFFLLYIYNILTLILVIALYYFFKSTFSATTGLTILLLFVLTQVFVLLRVGIKLLNIAGAGYLYKGSLPEEVEVGTVIK